MVYLLLNVICASSFMLGIKWIKMRHREDIITVGAINYIVAALLVAPSALRQWGLPVPWNAVITGATMGTCYFIAFFFVIYAVARIGAASSTVISVLSILLPMSVGVLVWGEQPNSYQWWGAMAALVALLLIGWRPRQVSGEERSRYAPWVLLAFFLMAGLSRLSQEAFKHMCLPVHRPVFLFVAFLVAATASVIVLVGRRRRIEFSELLLGSGLGASNILQSFFILKALEYFEGFVVFPVVSAGGLVLTTIVASGMMRESISRPALAGISIAVLALVLLNWMP